MLKLTLKWLNEQGACKDGVQWWKEHKTNDPIKAIKGLMNGNRFDYANWLIVRLMTHEQQIKYAIFAAEQVIGIYEKQYSKDDRPRKAIEAAKEYLTHPDKKHKAAAYAAAYAATYAAYAAYAAADAATYAAAAATYAYAAAAAAAAAANAAAAAKNKTKVIEAQWAYYNELLAFETIVEDVLLA
jgi:hypothetical protein